MSPRIPRELLAVFVAVDASTITATFTLGEPIELEQPAEWYTYGLALTRVDGAAAKHFGVRFSPTETKAYIFDFESATQANYDASHVEDRDASLVVRFPDSALGVDAIGSVTGFATVEGDDVAVDVSAQLLH